MLPKPQAQAIQWGMVALAEPPGGEDSWGLWLPEVASLLTSPQRPTCEWSANVCVAG